MESSTLPLSLKPLVKEKGRDVSGLMNSQDGDMCIHYVCMDRYTDTDTEVFKEEVD